MKRLSIPVEKFTLEDVENDDRIAKLVMKFMHDGVNLNKSSIGLDVIQVALDDSFSSVTGIPILASFNEDETDFKEHNDDEISIGFVPQINNNLHIDLEEENNKNYVYVDGYIWRHYSKNAVDILEKADDKSKSCSIEIEVLDGYRDKKKGVYVITSFKFLGITLLGSNYSPGMELANVQLDYVLNIKNKYSETFKDLSQELDLYFNKKNVIDNQLNIITENFSEDINNEIEKEVGVMPKTKKEIAVLFSLTMEQLEDEIRRNLRTVTYICEDYWYGEAYECRKFWLQDYDENFAYVYDCEKDIYVKLSYAKQGDDVSIDFESAKRIKFSPTDWEGAAEDENIETEIDAIGEVEMTLKEAFTSKVDSIVSAKVTEAVNAKEAEFALKETELVSLTEKYATLEKSITDNSEELKTLQEFKATTLKTETQNKADALFIKYAEYINEDEKKELNSKLFEFEKYENFETEVKAFVLPKVEAKNFALSQNPVVKTNPIDVSFMGIPVDENNKNGKEKTSVDVLREFVES